jgi:hypothetical protein
VSALADVPNAPRQTAIAAPVRPSVIFMLDPPFGVQRLKVQ